MSLAEGRILLAEIPEACDRNEELKWLQSQVHELTGGVLGQQHTGQQGAEEQRGAPVPSSGTISKGLQKLWSCGGHGRTEEADHSSDSKKPRAAWRKGDTKSDEQPCENGAVTKTGPALLPHVKLAPMRSTVHR